MPTSLIIITVHNHHIWEEQNHIIEFLHIAKHCTIESAAYQEKGGTIVQFNYKRDSSGQRLKCRDYPARIGMVGNYEYQSDRAV